MNSCLYDQQPKLSFSLKYQKQAIDSIYSYIIYTLHSTCIAPSVQKSTSIKIQSRKPCEVFWKDMKRIILNFKTKKKPRLISKVSLFVGDEEKNKIQKILKKKAHVFL
jgi:hypothetical protein